MSLASAVTRTAPLTDNEQQIMSAYRSAMIGEPFVSDPLTGQAATDPRGYMVAGILPVVDDTRAYPPSRLVDTIDPVLAAACTAEYRTAPVGFHHGHDQGMATVRLARAVVWTSLKRNLCLALGWRGGSVTYRVRRVTLAVKNVWQIVGLTRRLYRYA